MFKLFSNTPFCAASTPLFSPFINLPKPCLTTPIDNIFSGIVDAAATIVNIPIDVVCDVADAVDNLAHTIINEPAKIIGDLPSKACNLINDPNLDTILALVPDHCVPCAIVGDLAKPILEGVANIAADVVFDGALTAVSQVIAGVMPADDSSILNAPKEIQHDLGSIFTGVHGFAEGVFATTGIQPIVGFFDEAFIHPVLWETLGTLTDSDVADHPDALENSTGYFDTMLSGPGMMIEGLVTAVEGVANLAVDVVLDLTGATSLISGAADVVDTTSTEVNMPKYDINAGIQSLSTAFDSFANQAMAAFHL